MRQDKVERSELEQPHHFRRLARRAKNDSGPSEGKRRARVIVASMSTTRLKSPCSMTDRPAPAIPG
jgi:hypothetical protein